MHIWAPWKKKKNKKNKNKIKKQTSHAETQIMHFDPEKLNSSQAHIQEFAKPKITKINSLCDKVKKNVTWDVIKNLLNEHC